MTLERELARPGPRLSRGRGIVNRARLLTRLRSGEASIDAESAAQLAEILASLRYAVEDAEAEAQRNLRVTGRTIAQAIRRPHG